MTGIALALALSASPASAGVRAKAEVVKNYMRQKLGMKKTVQDRLDEFEQPVRSRLEPHFTRAGVRYPPSGLTIVGLKEEAELRLFAPGPDGRPRHVRTYPVLKASGGPGPKLREGDGQVPEGLYGIESLNPNSLFHLSLRVNYPNAFDREQAKRDGRARLGGDIMIHGNEVSIGCLAMGDEAAEDLFVLAAKTGLPKIRVILAPHDFRRRLPAASPGGPAWIAELYREISRELVRLPPP